MLDLSFSEMLLAGTVALVVLGPERLPKVARTLGEWAGKVQRLAANVKSELSAQADYADLQKIKTEVESAAQDIRGNLREFEAQLAEEGGRIGRGLDPQTPAWERLPELKTPADFGIAAPPPPSARTAAAAVSFGAHRSLRKQAMARRRDARPRPRPAPKLRSRR